MAAPYVNMRFMPTGGVNVNNLTSYLDFSKIIACGGSWMVPGDLINEGAWDKIEALTREAVYTMLGFELIHRGHRLVSDDVVEIRKISDDTLLGTSPDITRHFIELRGIGIVDVKTLFGVESVMYNQTIDMVIRLEDWNREANYDRLGLDEEYIEFLGNKVVCYSIPIRPGRNLAVIVESAAINYRAKKMGYNAAQELYNRVTGSLSNNTETEKDE